MMTKLRNLGHEMALRETEDGENINQPQIGNVREFRVNSTRH